jgi:peptidoglycan/LPS O-acetylase OafA/YrhL
LGGVSKARVTETHDEFPCIDGLRAFAAVAVVLCHTVGVSNIINSTPGAYLAGLRAGVQIFFVISGFVLYRPFAKAHRSGQRGPSLGTYFRRRLFRIFPAYWLVLTVGFLALGVIHFYDGAALTNYLLLQGYFHEPLSGLGPAWTLVIEVTFYVFLPFYAFAIWLVGRGRVLTAELVGCGFLFLVGVACAGWTANAWPPLFVTVLPANLTPFALGMALAVVRTSISPQGRSWQWAERAFGTPWKSWLVAAFAFSATVWAVHYPAILSFLPIPAHTQMAYLGLIDLMGLCVVLPAVFGNQQRGAGRRILSTGPMLFLGAISYGIYLWHVPLMDKMLALNIFATPTSGPPRVNFVGMTALTLGLTCLAATLSWYLLEKPLMRFSHIRHPVSSLLHRWRRDVVESPAMIITTSPTSSTASPTTRIVPSPATVATSPGNGTTSAANTPASWASIDAVESAMPNDAVESTKATDAVESVKPTAGT